MQKFIVAHPNGETTVLTDPQEKDFHKVLGKRIALIRSTYPQASVSVCANADTTATSAPRNHFASYLMGVPVYGNAMLISSTPDTHGQFQSLWDDTPERMENINVVASVVKLMNA